MTYLWLRLVRDAHWPAPVATAMALGLVALGASLPLVLILFRGRGYSGQGPRAVAWVAFVWLGLMFIWLTLTVGSDLVRLLAGLWQWAWPVDPAFAVERRQWLSRLSALVVLGAGLGAAAWGMRTALGGPQTTPVQVFLRRWPKALDGFRIVQISDLHVAPLLDKAYVTQVVAQANALNADLIAITGDLIDGSVSELKDKVAPLAELKARLGVFFVTGNHEYYSGVGPWLVELEALGFKILRNERVRIGTAPADFDLAGIDDYTSLGMHPGHGPDLPRAVSGRDASRELVLMAHQPRHMEVAVEADVGLMLSGHTHGGQIWPFGFLVRLVQPFLSGLGRQGNTQIYVNRGTGYWGPPIRLGAPPELTLLQLYRAEG